MINERVLRIRDVLVIGPDGDTIGVMQSRQALGKAKELGLDLYLVSPNAVPPVCKIVNYGKLKYEESKKARENKKAVCELKEVKISPRIASHDLQTMTKRAKEFLSKGHKVKITCVFKGREVTTPEFGKEKIEIMMQDLDDICVVDKPVNMEEKLMTIFLSPKK